MVSFIPMVPITHYSTINALLICACVIFKIREIYPFMICNTFGTVGTWYSALVIDPTIPARMMAKHGWTRPMFIIGDIGLKLLINSLYIPKHRS